MDMSMSSLSVCPSPSTIIVLLITFLWLVLPPVWRSRAPLAAALVPLALNVADAWLVVINAFRGMAISGPHSIASIAAGLAEAQGRVLYGLFVSAFMLAIFAIIAYRRRYESRENRIVVACAILIAAAAVATLFIRWNGPIVALYYAMLTTTYAMFAIAAVLAVVALWKRAQPASWRWLAIALLANIILAIVVRIVMLRFEHIAGFGS
jgi:dolichyl-phosphate-mannose--protein O-mannosyl transferase